MVIRDFPSFALVLEFPTGRNFYTLHQKNTTGIEKENMSKESNNTASNFLP
jgi:hypothetical protein